MTFVLDLLKREKSKTELAIKNYEMLAEIGELSKEFKESLDDYKLRYDELEKAIEILTLQS